MRSTACPVCKKGFLNETGKRMVTEDGTILFNYFECETCGLEFFRRPSKKREKCEVCGFDKHPFALYKHHVSNNVVIVVCGTCHSIITRTGQHYSRFLDENKIQIMLDAVVSVLHPLNSNMLRELLAKEIKKYRLKKLPEFPKHKDGGRNT